MSNWAERGKQENERQAAEAAATQHALNLGKQSLERQKYEQRQFVIGKLSVYEQLGVPRLLEEIRRDIWKGFGKVDSRDPSTQNHESGSINGEVSTYLHADMDVILPETETAHLEHYGEYEVEGRADLSGKWITYKTAMGNHKHYAGERIMEVRETKKEIERLTITLRYQQARDEAHYVKDVRNPTFSVREVKRLPAKYVLGTGSSIFDTEEFIDTDPLNPAPTLSLEDARQKLDKLLLRYAAHGVRDFQALKAESDEARRFILRHVGRLTKDVPGLHEIEYKMRRFG